MELHKLVFDVMVANKNDIRRHLLKTTIFAQFPHDFILISFSILGYLTKQQSDLKHFPKYNLFDFYLIVLYAKQLIIKPSRYLL